MTAVSDDEIIKRKLLIEGESGNDDRRLTLLLKNYLRWVASSDVGDSGFETFQALIGSINQCENAMEQATLVLAMNTEQQHQYSLLQQDIKSETDGAKIRIEECKEELRTARIIRKNRREYDALAKVIAEHPERDTTLSKCTKLQSQLRSLQRLNEEYDQKISLRKKQFHLFLFALNDLQKLVEDDDGSQITLDDLSTVSSDSTLFNSTVHMDTD